MENTEVKLTETQKAIILKQAEIGGMNDQIIILQTIASDFKNAVGKNITGISFLYTDRIITLKSYLADTTQYTDFIGDVLGKINPLIQKEIKEHQKTLKGLQVQLDELNLQDRDEK